jgi:drug/metabolite transporter (DMT)-like permease
MRSPGNGSITTRRGLAFALSTAIVSGFAVFVNGVAVRRFDDATVYTTAKNLIAGALLVTAAITVGRFAHDRPAAPRRSWPALGVIAVIGGAVPFVLFFEGLSRATSTNAAFIHKTLVVWVALGASVLLKERVTMVHASAIALLLLGHFVLTGGLGATTFGSAEILVLAATLSWSAEVIVLKRLPPSVVPEIAAVARMAGGSVLLVGWVALRGELGALVGLDLRQWAWVLLTGATLAAFVTVWYTALSLAPAVDVTAVLVLGAVITGLLNSGFRGVPLTADSYGFVLIALGVLAVAARSLADPSSSSR